MSRAFCFGHLSWIFVAHYLLRGYSSKEIYLSAYADDFVIIIKENTRKQLDEIANRRIDLCIKFAVTLI